MNNAEKFKQIFGLRATELWSMRASDLFTWLERDVEITQPDHIAESGKKVSISCGHENDLIGRRAAIDAIDKALSRTFTEPCGEMILKDVPSAQPERTCVNCGRTVNNGGWYADGRTRCPIEEHYALPKDGYCHLWEKRNVTDDDYPERREE